MNDADIVAAVHRLILNAMPDPMTEQSLGPEMSLRSDLGIESLALATVIFGLEEAFGIDLAELDVDFRGIETVGDMVAKGVEIARAAGRGS